MGHTCFKYQIQFNVIYVLFADINILTKNIYRPIKNNINSKAINQQLMLQVLDKQNK